MAAGVVFLAVMSSSRIDDITHSSVWSFVCARSDDVMLRCRDVARRRYASPVVTVSLVWCIRGDVARRCYASPVVTVSLLAKFYPIFWYVRPL